MPPNLTIRTADQRDSKGISRLLERSGWKHQHLDWYQPIELLDLSPFYKLEDRGSVRACMAAPPDDPLIAWIRLFACEDSYSLTKIWSALLEPILLALKTKNVRHLNVMAIGNWIVPLLTDHGFSSINEVLFLEWQDNPPPEFQSSEIRIRPLNLEDIPSVVAVDQAAFQPLWRHSLPTLRKALEQSAHCTVLETADQIIGYQISTASALGAHLARLAVLPARQGQGLGRMLVSETIQWMLTSGIDRMTVNTQTDNETSLKLYKALGFRETGIQYPVYALSLS